MIDLYYDRDGNVITSLRWAELFEDRNEPPYKRIDETHIGPIRVSTVWLGLNHNWDPKGPLLIFETMVFSSETEFAAQDEYTRRYSTEEQARVGHQEVVDEVSASLGGSRT